MANKIRTTEITPMSYIQCRLQIGGYSTTWQKQCRNTLIDKPMRKTTFDKEPERLASQCLKIDGLALIRQAQTFHWCLPDSTSLLQRELPQRFNLVSMVSSATHLRSFSIEFCCASHCHLHDRAIHQHDWIGQIYVPFPRP